MSEDFDEEYGSPTAPGEEFASLWPILQDQNVADLIAMYREKRDELAVHRKAYKQKEANVKDLLDRISMALRDKADALGVDSFATQVGTAYRSTKKKYRVGDWFAFIGWAKDNDMLHLLEKRVAKNAALEVHEARKLQAADMPEDFDPVPPGLIYVEDVTMDVRKPTGNRKST